jgi:predicted nucleic acid-binding protein
MVTRGLLDTSVWIAAESGRSLATELLPAEAAISVVTVGELAAGVLAAVDARTRALRLRTLNDVADIEALPVDVDVARRWAELRVQLRSVGRRPPANDVWIAATALVHGLPIVTQDDDFAPLADVVELAVIRV